MSYSIDLRKRVIAFIESGRKKQEASRRFNVCRPTINKWLLLKKETGSLEDPVLQPRSARKLGTEALLAHIEANPNGKLEDYAEHFQASPSGVWRALKRLKVTRKKRPLSIKKEMRRNEQHFWSR